ncbi:MAG TPA: ATP-binding protein [Thermoanaerobaculia bacterium]|nr:ATP-binding protein [Thermoanaerobaculia bacterium]
MRLRNRITLTLVGIAAILLAPAIYGLLNLRELESIVRDLQTRNAAAILALGRLATAVEEVDNAQRIYLAFGGQPEDVRAPAADRVDERSARVEEALAQLGTAGFDELIGESRERWRRVDRLLAEQRRHLEAGDLAAADELSEARLGPVIAALSSSLDELARRVDQRGERQLERATTLAAEAVRTTVLAMIAAAVAVLLVGAALGRNLLRPIAALSGATRQVAGGDFEVDLATTAVREDELGELGRAFDRMTTELAELDRLKAEFVSVASHELKTPLSVIKGYVALLGEDRFGEMTPRGREVLATLERQAAHLDRMIRRLLDVSRYEAGGGRLELSRIDLPAFLAHLEESFAALALQSRIDFGIERQTDLPVYLIADADRLNEVIGNLLSNAFKFTPEGGTIRLAARAGEGEEDEEGQRVVMEVRDSGPGIPAAALPRVFDKFYQVDNQPSTPRQPGSGLGLAIARHIVEAHGGTIEVESEIGRGTTFRVVMPLEPSAASGRGGI